MNWSNAAGISQDSQDGGEGGSASLLTAPKETTTVMRPGIFHHGVLWCLPTLALVAVSVTCNSTACNSADELEPAQRLIFVTICGAIMLWIAAGAWIAGTTRLVLSDASISLNYGISRSAYRWNEVQEINAIRINAPCGCGVTISGIGITLAESVEPSRRPHGSAQLRADTGCDLFIKLVDFSVGPEVFALTMRMIKSKHPGGSSAAGTMGPPRKLGWFC
jgi:hypothetical protein